MIYGFGGDDVLNLTGRVTHTVRLAVDGGYEDHLFGSVAPTYRLGAEWLPGSGSLGSGLTVVNPADGSDRVTLAGYGLAVDAAGPSFREPGSTRAAPCRR